MFLDMMKFYHMFPKKASLLKVCKQKKASRRVKNNLNN